MQENQNGVILFDGVCNFCNTWVNRIIKADKKRKFRFAPIQSNLGQEMMKNYGLDPIKFDSVIFINNHQAYTYSTAVLHIAKKLGGLYALIYVFIIVPPFIRNSIYKWIGNNRYKWFGRKESCMVPTAEIRSRFLA